MNAGWKDYHNAILTNGDTIPVVDRVQAFLNIDQLLYRQTIGALDISTGNIKDEIREVRLRLHDTFANQVDVNFKAVYQSGQFTSSNTNKFTVAFDATQDRITAQSIMRLGFLNKQGLFNLAGFKLIADWEVDFYLEAENLIVTYTATRELTIRDFDNTETDGIIDYIKVLDPDTDAELVTLCDYEKDNVKCEVQITPPNAEDVWYLHAFTDEHPYGVRANSDNDLEKQQEYTGRLPQEQSVEIFDQDIVFDANNKAYFYLNLDQVNALKAGRIYVVVKKAPLIPIGEGNACFDELKSTKGNSGSSYDGKPIRQSVAIDKQIMLDMDDYNDSFFLQNGLTQADERPFIMIVGLGKTGSDRVVKGEILKDDTVVATTGETGGNYGPFDPNDSNLVYNSDFYIKDDTDLNIFPPTRIQEFIDEWGFLPLWPYGIPYGGGSTCQETLDTWIDQFTEWLNNKCAQLVWCKYTRAELEDSSTDFDLVMWWNMKANPLRDKALYSTCNCMLVPLCPEPQASYLRESEVGTLYNKYRTSGSQVFLDVTLLMSMTTYSAQPLSGTSNFKTRLNTGLTNTEYPFAGGGTPPLNINTSENYSDGQTDGFEVENIYQTNPDGYKWGAWIKGGAHTAPPLAASTGSSKILNIGVFNSYDSGDPLGDWVRFRYQFSNSGNIDIPIDSVVVEVYKEGITSYDAEGRIQLSGGTLVYNQTVATSYTGFTSATFLDLNLEEDIRHQFVLKFIEGGVITGMALIEQDLKKEP